MAEDPDGKSVDSELTQLKEENRKMQNEFNAQRARLKELYLQKESEFKQCQAERDSLVHVRDDLKSQLTVLQLKAENEIRDNAQKSQEEISSLQRLVQDTIEESANIKASFDRLKEENNILMNELRRTRIVPQVLTKAKETLVRKLGSANAATPETSDETPRSTSASKLYDQEDSEVLRSLVEQLQNENVVLKEKLREADKKIQENAEHESARAVDSNTVDGTASSSSNGIFDCAACRDKHKELQALRDKEAEYKEKIEELTNDLEESREELTKEIQLRNDLDKQWIERRDQHKQEVETLQEQVAATEKEMLKLHENFLLVKEGIYEQFDKLAAEREAINERLIVLQADNDYLSGRYLATAEEIDSQNINLPTTVPELHELLLGQRELLVQARLSSEYEKRNGCMAQEKIEQLTEELRACSAEHRSYTEKVQREMKSLQTRLTEHLVTLQNCETAKVALERKEGELNLQISELKVQIIGLQEANEKVKKAHLDAKAKIKNLQEDLMTSEQVQKDFVKLSQSLQMSLEQLRHADTEVRWQDDEDIDNCPVCKTGFTVTVRKIHCRHCGHIYCDKCLTKTVPSGPRKRTARVCDICHTLLTPNKAPYFSEEKRESN